MDSVKRKILKGLVFAPSVVLPIVGGTVAAVLAWVAGGNLFLSGVAVIGILGGVGWMFARMLLKVEEVTAQALQAGVDKQLREENRQLDVLARRLRNDRDHRTQDYLTLLRSVRDEFEKTAQKPGVVIRSARIREQVGLIFETAVEQLRQSYRLWELSESLAGAARDKVLVDREQVVLEIGATVDRLQLAVNQFNELIKSDEPVDLASMHEELEATMRIAQRTEERMREIENPPSNFEAFDKE